MLLTIDVGNTNIVMGAYNEEHLVASWRLSTRVEMSADEIGMFMCQLLEHDKIDIGSIEAVIISSVVPPIMFSLEKAVKRYIGKTPIVVGPGLKTGVNIKYDNPKEVGADRIVNAVSAINIYKAPLVIIDFGTATTFCAINGAGDYLGGVICPGIKISIDALYNKTAKLPKIELVKPEKVIGTNTVVSMQAGIIYGYVGQIDYIVRRMKEEIGENGIKVVATGGMANIIAKESKEVDIVNPMLTLEGLRIIYEKNIKKS